MPPSVCRIGHELADSDMQEYAEKARDLRKAGARDHEQWVKSQNPQEVYKANRARRHLRRLGGKVALLKDPRIPKRPVPVTFAFLRDQWRAGTFNNPDGTNMDIVAAMRLSRDLYQKLSPAEKKVSISCPLTAVLTQRKARLDIISNMIYLLPCSRPTKTSMRRIKSSTKR